MQADGNLVAYDNSNVAFWASNSCCQNRRTPMTTFIQVGAFYLAHSTHILSLTVAVPSSTCAL